MGPVGSGDGIVSGGSRIVTVRVPDNFDEWRVVGGQWMFVGPCGCKISLVANGRGMTLQSLRIQVERHNFETHAVVVAEELTAGHEHRASCHGAIGELLCGE